MSTRSTERAACGPAAGERDDCVHLLIGVAGLILTGMTVHEADVGRREATTFRAVNGLPDWLFPLVWTVMQAGALGAAPVAAGAAAAAGRPLLARRLILGGTATWALSKVVKRVIRRPRPALLLAGTRRRGRDATGLGYVSGHAGVAVAMTVAALPYLHGRARWATRLVAPVVGLARMYVGAHLPLDVLGGASLGLAVDGALGLADHHH